MDRKREADPAVVLSPERIPKRVKTIKPSATSEATNDVPPQINARNGLRFIEPYLFEFRTHAKGRWLGRQLLEVLTKEFQSHSPEYYARAIAIGRITVNRARVTESYVFLNNDLLSHVTHRHEPPVTAEPVAVLYEDGNIIVVNKPGSIPVGAEFFPTVHPTGRYRHNSILHILRHERKIPQIFACHRLDRLTSGVLIMAKNKETARRMADDISARTVHKEYLCRVRGHFPAGEIVCEEPLKVVNARLGICHVDVEGKASRSVFVLVHHDALSSVVRCRPETGRTHQLRVHLAHLGHPILNDPLYGLVSRRAASAVPVPAPVPAPGAGAASTSSSNLHTSTSHTALIAAAIEARHAIFDASFAQLSPRDPVEGSAQYESCSPLDPDCFECTVRRPDPRPEELFLCLHAAHYAGPTWAYDASPPWWAAPGAVVRDAEVREITDEEPESAVSVSADTEN